jgi:NADPH:quinone reductase-like Zn-dependent oxidoreductase
MKASFFRSFGGPEVLEYGELPDPVPAAGEVLVDIHAASINAADWKMRRGGYGAMAFPHVPGRDFSGVVVRSAGDFKPGDEVFGVCLVPQEGAYAEKIAIREAIIARKPAQLSHVQCAAIALIGLTAVISIEDTLKLKRGETILIQGGAGGVAGFAIALARHLGARVITTASADNHAYVRMLGADRAIDYRKDDFTKLVSGCDAVFDTVGGDVTARSFAVLKPGGRFARRRRVAAPEGRPRPPASRARCPACRRRRGAAAGHRRVPARPGGRRPPRERGPAPARQASASRSVALPTRAAAWRACRGASRPAAAAHRGARS